MRITLDFFSEYLRKQEALKSYVLVRALKSFKIALPEKDLIVRKEDVFTIQIRVAKILVKKGWVEYINTPLLKGDEENAMGEAGKVDMAKVEGK